jgi:hypothetical protein
VRFVPWLFWTLAGFFAAVIVSAVVVKTAITTALAAWRARNSRAEERLGP